MAQTVEERTTSQAIKDACRSCKKQGNHSPVAFLEGTSFANTMI
jgi:hypothetical protein